MASHKIVTLLSLATAALATSTQDQYPVPYNAQVGALRLPIQCSAMGINLQLDGFYTGTLPIYAAPQQPTYITDVTAAITIPASISSLVGLLGVSYADTQIFVNIRSENASPETFPALPNGLWVNGTKISAGKPITVQVPSKGVLPPIGPATATTVGKDAGFFLGEITAKIYLYNSQGKLVYGPLNLDCPAVKRAISLGAYNVQGNPNTTAFAPANGYKLNYPALKTLEEVGYFNVPYICDLGPFKNLVFNLFFGGVLKGKVPAGGKYSLTNITSTLSVDQALIDAAHQVYGAQTFESTVSDVQLNITNSSPASINLLKTPVKQTYTYSPSGGLPLNIPVTGTLTAGPFTAGSTAGNYMVISIGTATANLVLKDSSGNVVQTLPASCHPQGGLDLYGILIGAA